MRFSDLFNFVDSSLIRGDNPSHKVTTFGEGGRLKVGAGKTRRSVLELCAVLGFQALYLCLVKLC